MLGRGPGRDHRGAGWEAVHVCVDDATRLAYVEVLADERAITTDRVLRTGRRVVRDPAVSRVRQVLSDNGSPYRSHLLGDWCATHRIEHLRTRPYRPRTNGKAERFIQTMLREWAYPPATAPQSIATCTARMGRLLQPPTTTRRPRTQDTRQPAQAD